MQSLESTLYFYYPCVQFSQSAKIFRGSVAKDSRSVRTFHLTTEVTES